LGVDATLLTDKTSKDNKVNVNATYRHDWASIKAGVEKKVGSDYLATISAATDYEGITAGVQGKFKVYPVPQKQADILQEVNAGLRYSTGNLHIVSVFEKMETVKVGVAQTINPRLVLGAEFSHNVKVDKDGKVQTPSFAFGGNYVIDADSSVSGKVNTKGVANVAYKVRVNPNITTAISVETNVNDLVQPSKVGLAFEIDA